ncbi:ATP-binding protein [Planomonospora venezuelensis]|uniref:Anti-sigma regulatory factor (Ser/Thr protein kinase) n=1 Tax=Planomonospora venezuelensis TaxID=1999 RepID=A0A841D8U3_PLAVE|nr:ATP-binding protein [Planomonospora venezuelensis]MBB5966370.1 anti-sigma regulatory factor (Ser/Thr protein kinase) [Planomonospora venezuelensis]GIN02803.1 hypothetical protein Pve01_44610 [Planomonospora venezuelensis]
MDGADHGAYEIEHRLTEEMGSLLEARKAAGRALAACAYAGRHEDVILVVSELVTNALLHGAGAPVLRVIGTPSRVRVEVADAGARLPRPRDPGPFDGFGLNVVQRLSACWGVRRRRAGKAVWCELAARPDPAVL